MVLCPSQEPDSRPKGAQDERFSYAYPPKFSSPQLDRFSSSNMAPRYNSLTQDGFAAGAGDSCRPQELSDAQQRRQPPVPIEEALRQHCGIPAKQYFVAAMTEGGAVTTFSSPGPTLPPNTFFNEEKWRLALRNQGSTGVNSVVETSSSPEQNAYRLHTTSLIKSEVNDRQHESPSDEYERPIRHNAKRRRGRTSFGDEAAPVVFGRVALIIGRTTEIRNYYHSIFVAIQQNACKITAKAWIKLIAPKKQSTHPYTGGDESAPEWWPKASGEGREQQKVRHTEPDHISKPERIHLLIHILRMALLPPREQPESIRHQGINAQKLADVAFEALSSHFTEQEEKDVNKEKRPGRECLRELFLVARCEQRWRHGEVDEYSIIHVKGSQKGQGQRNNVSDSDDEEAQVKKEAQLHPVEQAQPPQHQHAQYPAAQNQQQYQRAGPNASHSLDMPEQRAPALHTNPYLGNLQARDFPASAMVPDITAHQHPSFVENNGMPLQASPAVNTAGPGLAALDFASSSHPHGSRRPSVYSDYSNHGNGALYASQWSSGSTAPTTPVAYAYAAQPTNGHHDNAFVGQDMSMSQNTPFFGGSFDSSRSGYETDSFRSAELPSMNSLHLHQG